MAKISRPISPLADVNVTLRKDRSNVDCSKPDVDLLIGERISLYVVGFSNTLIFNEK